jgi:hypothetical protein
MFVSAFYNKVFQNLAELNIHVHIWQMPVELPGPIQPFSENTKQASYGPDAVRRHWQIWGMEEAYSHEVSSAGFWPGSGLGEAAFYSYTYPEPDGFSKYSIRPKGAYYHKELREFILPYENVRTANEPDTQLLEFLQSTYEPAADLANWDRKGLEVGKDSRAK